MYPYQCFTKIRDRQSGGTVTTTLRHDIIYYQWWIGLHVIMI